MFDIVDVEDIIEEARESPVKKYGEASFHPDCFPIKVEGDIDRSKEQVPVARDYEGNHDTYTYLTTL